MTRGTAVVYRSLRGETWQARISGARGESGVVDLDVIVPGSEHPVALSRIEPGDKPGQWSMP